MCGIVGYIGKNQATPVLVEGLKRLEYRGYDSAGVTIYDRDRGLTTRKCVGRIKNLEGKLDTQPLEGCTGIGHTRWATHGEPSDTNSHPHTNKAQTISVVHNGIIENYIYLREWLISKGFTFYSETDTEVIPNLIEYYYQGDIVRAVSEAARRLEGSYALGVLCSLEPEKLICIKKESPLLIGAGEGENFIASDPSAILKYTRQVYYMQDAEVGVLTCGGISFCTLDGETLTKQPETITWSSDAAEKGGYEHFMLKEIHEQPTAIKAALSSRIVPGKPITLDNINLSADDINGIDRIFITACGTAYHAGLVGKYLIEKLAKIPVEADIASEFRYRDPIITNKNLLIVISQSGETADTIAALRLGKKNGARVIAITNVVGSTVSREADDVLYMWAGPEIAVAATKTYPTQLIALYELALYMAQSKNTLTNDEIEAIKAEMLLLPEKAEKVLEMKETLQRFASRTFNHRDMFYLGRGLDYALAMEGALKLKEISYIHTESYAGGELKHGTIALIEEGTVVIAMATQGYLKDKMISNMQQVTSRGAKVMAFTMEDSGDISGMAEYVFRIPRVMDLLAPVIAIIPLQLYAYYVAVMRGCDVDKPRNLAKSVTVE